MILVASVWTLRLCLSREGNSVAGRVFGIPNLRGYSFWVRREATIEGGLEFYRNFHGMLLNLQNEKCNFCDTITNFVVT